MGLKEVISNVIDKYGFDAVLKSYTTTTNDYGEVVDDSYTETNIKVVFFDNPKVSFLRQIFGLEGQNSQTFLIKADIPVDENSRIVIDGREYQINEVSSIHYKDQVVAQILFVS